MTTVTEGLSQYKKKASELINTSEYMINFKTVSLLCRHYKAKNNTQK